MAARQEYVRRMKPKSRMKLISLWIPEPMLKAIDELVERGFFPSKSELIRYAIAEYLRSMRGYGFSGHPRMFFGP
ncbi:MAG: CopG family transcriptional regulator [Thermoprotei archaeon]|nr:MAG: CopG family transcriptional regulator [Thermoprotei archaeon]